MDVLRLPAMLPSQLHATREKPGVEGTGAEIWVHAVGAAGTGAALGRRHMTIENAIATSMVALPGNESATSTSMSTKRATASA